MGISFISDFMDWLFNNKEWLFSGIGLAIVSTIATMVYRKFICKSQDDKTKIKQINKGENNTQIAIQNNYYKGAEEKDNE